MKTGLDNSSTGATDSTSIKALQRRCSSQLANPSNTSAKSGTIKQQSGKNVNNATAVQEVDYSRGALLNISQSSIDKGKIQSSKISQSSLNNTQKLKSSSRKGNSAKRQSYNKLQKDTIAQSSDNVIKQYKQHEVVQAGFQNRIIPSRDNNNSSILGQIIKDSQANTI